MNAQTQSKIDELIDWIRSTTDVANGRGVVIPVSGGSDSALCFWLCAKALPRERVLAVFIGKELRCREWFERQGNVRFIPELGHDENIKHVELQRWAIMLSQSLECRGWLVGTRNRTEELLGTYSLASRLATYLPLFGLWKSEVMDLAAAVGVPMEIIESSQRADPSCGRPKQMADIPFGIVDLFLKVRQGEQPESSLQELPNATLDYLQSIYDRNQFKAHLPLCGPIPTRRDNDNL